MILYVTGHIHCNRVIPWFKSGGRSGFWQVTTASHMSFPQQTRLVELMDYGNGTLSIVNTVLDTAAPVQPPAGGHAGRGLTDGQLGSLSRMLSANVRERAGDRHGRRREPVPVRQRRASACRIRAGSVPGGERGPGRTPLPASPRRSTA